MYFNPAFFFKNLFPSNAFEISVVLLLFSPASGRVFMFGPNDWGQLGIGTETKAATKPSCIKCNFFHLQILKFTSIK